MDVLPLITVAAGAGVIVLIVVVSLYRQGLIGGRVTRSRRRSGGGFLRRLRPSRRGRRRLVRGSVVALVLTALVVAAEGAQLGRAGLAITRGASTLKEAETVLGTSPEGWTSQRITSAQTLQVEAADNIETGNRAIQGDAVLRFLARAPLTSADAGAVLALADSSASAARAMSDYIAIARAVDDSGHSTAPPGSRLLGLLSAVRTPSSDAKAALASATGRLVTAHAAAPASALDVRLTAALAVLRPLQAQADVLSALASFGPAAMGATKPITYLVLLPNPTELRPAGGFSGAIGTVTMSAGAPSGVTVHNQDDFNPLMRQRQPVPAPLARYLTFYKNGLELGDAGWDPDFPTTARLSEVMYESAVNQAVDGTLSVDPYALAALLTVTGPIDVAPYGRFDSGNFVSKLNLIVNVENAPSVGKAALSPISKAVLDRVLTLPANDWPRFVTVLRDQAEQRHVQAYFHDPALAQAVASVHYDGALVTPPGDYLMLADANVGSTKGDFFVKKSMQVKSEIQADRGVVLHEVLVTYDMPPAGSAVDRLLNPGDGSYRDYLRLIIPEEAAVASVHLSATGGGPEGGLDTMTLSHDKQEVAVFVRVPRGRTSTVSLVYEVPLAPTRDYQLYLQKQAGATPLTTELVTSYPGGFTKDAVSLASDRSVRVAW